MQYEMQIHTEYLAKIHLCIPLVSRTSIKLAKWIEFNLQSFKITGYWRYMMVTNS